MSLLPTLVYVRLVFEKKKKLLPRELYNFNITSPLRNDLSRVCMFRLGAGFFFLISASCDHIKVNKKQFIRTISDIIGFE